MASKKIGKATVKFTNPPIITGTGAVVGPVEGRGPLARDFDVILPDLTFGEKTAEKSERKLLEQATQIAIERSGVDKDMIDYYIAGDLLNQIVSASFSARQLAIPFLGVYGACSTCAMGTALGGMILAYRIYAGGRTVNLTREQIRHKLGLESPRFHITVRDCEGQEIIVESRIELCSSAVLLFDGVGKGHGVGLSQWGAQSMALMCTSDGTPIYNYVDILKHYYPGTELVDNYGIPREHIEIASDVGVEPFYEGCEGSAEHVQPMEDDHVEPGCDNRAEPAQEDRDCARPISHDYTERTYEEDQKQIEPAHGDHIEFLPE